MSDDPGRSEYKRLILAAIEAQKAYSNRSTIAHKADDDAAGRLAAAAAARDAENRWIISRLDEASVAVEEGRAGIPGEIDPAVSVAPVAAPGDARAGLQAAAEKARAHADGINEGKRALLVWRARQASIRGGIGIALLVVLALIGLWIIRSLNEERAAEAGATATAEAIAAIALTVRSEEEAAATAMAEAGATATAEAIAAITLTAQAVEGSETAGEREHIVQVGENLHLIGAHYGFTFQELIDYNNLNNATDISVGQVIKIPPYPVVEKPPGPISEAGNVRTVDRGGPVAEQVFVPSGAFRMGSDGGEPDEMPIHTRQLDAFWLDQTEVTNAQYAACVAVGVCSAPEDDASLTRDDYYGNPVYANYPVVWVSWADADTFCRWAGGRLPTEAEWEYAARGPTSLEYPWGNTFEGSRLNYCDANCSFDWADSTVDDGHQDTAPVGSYPQGAAWSGALDMAGNVWEWVDDWYNEAGYSNITDNSSEDPDSGMLKVLRGGAWYGDWRVSRSADRNSRAVMFANTNIGFRCAADPGDLPEPITPTPTPDLITPTPTPDLITPTPTTEVCRQSPGPRWELTLWALHDERLGCALTGELRITAAFQPFDHGLMVWRQDRSLIYVLYNNDRFAAYPDNSDPNFKISDLIKGGFGHLWSTNKSVQQGLGHPKKAEAFATDFAIQDFRGGTIFYFFENDTRNYALFNDNGTWTSIQE